MHSLTALAVNRIGMTARHGYCACLEKPLRTLLKEARRIRQHDMTRTLTLPQGQVNKSIEVAESGFGRREGTGRPGRVVLSPRK